MRDEAHSLLFDPDSHSYWVDGERYLSITQILSQAGIIDSTWYTEESAQLGTRIHRLTEFMDTNDLNLETISVTARPYLNAYKEFKNTSGVKIHKIEYQCYSSIYRIAGTVDRVVNFQGHPAIIDLKTGLKSKWHSLQTAGYALILGADYERYNLYLSKTGTYRLDQHRNLKDFDVFIAALTLVNWKTHGKSSA